MSQSLTPSKKSTLWNIVQPGDPYDIKKSMIAKMPGDSQNFMGDYLDMVCLMQAAQIQRLSQYLSQYKQRYGELQRRQLDRHSYEIQIKQLIQRLAQQSNLKKQNFKLKDFLSRQTAQLQQLRKQLSQNHMNSSLQKNYQNSLLQIQSLMRQVNMFRQQKRIKSAQIEQYIARITAIQTSKNRQLQQLRAYLTDNSRFAFENQKRQLTLKFQSQISRLQFEVKKQKQALLYKNQQIQTLQIKISRLQQQNSSYSQNDRMGQELNRRIVQFQNKYAISSAEIQRLNMMINSKNNQCNEINNRFKNLQFQFQRRQSLIKEYQMKIHNLQKDINILNISLRDYKIQIQGNRNNVFYEEKINNLNMQLQRINLTLRQKNDQITNLSRRMQQYEYQIRNIQIIKRQNQDHKRQNQQINVKISTYEQKIYTFNQRVGQYQNKIALMAQQIQRLTHVIKAKSQQSLNYENHIKNLKYQIQNYRNKLNQVEGSINIDIQNKISSFQQKVYILNQENQNLRNKLNYLNQINGKLSQDLKQFEYNYRVLQNEFQMSKRKHNQFQSQISYEWQVKMNLYEQKLNEFGQQNQQLRRRLFQMTDINKRIPDYENKIAMLSQQIQRLTLNIRTREQQLGKTQISFKNLQVQIDNWRRRYIQLQNNAGSQIHSKISIYQQRIVVFTQQIQQYKMRLGQAHRQIERLNQNFNILENRNINIQKQLEASRRRLGESQRQIAYEWQNKISSFQSRINSFTIQNQQITRRLQDSQNRLGLANKQIERLSYALRIKGDQFGNSQITIRNLQLQIQNMKRRINQKDSSMSHQWTSKVTMYQQRISTFTRQNQQLKRRLQQIGDIGRKISEYQNKIAFLSQQVQRQNLALRAKTDQFISLQNKFRFTSQQLEGYRRKINQLQMAGSSSSKQWQVRISNFQQRITVFTRQNQDLKRKNSQLQNNLRIKIQQINVSSRNYQQEIQGLRRRLGETESSMIQQWRTKVSFFEQKIQIFTRENNDLQRKLNEAYMQIERFNKDNSSLNIKINQMQILRQTLMNSQSQYNRLNIENQNMIKQINDLANRIALLTKQNQNFKQQIRFLSEDSGKKSVSMTQQIERLNILIRNKTEQSNSMEAMMRNLRNQLQNSKRRMIQIQNNMSGQWHNKATVYQQKISLFTRQNDDFKRKLTEAQNKIVIQLQEIQRLNQVLRGKVDQINSGQNKYRNLIQQIENYKRKINDMQSSMSHEWHSKITYYQQNLSNVSRQNEDLKRRINQITEKLNRGGNQYESKINILSQQIQRLNITIRTKIDQGNNAEFRVRNLQQQIDVLKRRLIQSQSNINIQWRSKITMYQEKISSYTRQIQLLNLRLRDQDGSGKKIAQYQTKIAMLSQQLQRMNSSLRIKNQEFMRLQITYNQIRIKYEQYEMKSGGKQGQYSKLLQAYNLISQQYEKSRHYIVEYETNIKRLYSEFEKLQTYVNQIRQQNTMLRRQLEEGGVWFEKNKILSNQINRLTLITEQQKIQLQQVRIRLSDDIALQKRINEHMALMVVLFAQIESLRKRVQDKQKQCQEVRRSSLAPFKSL